MGNINIKFYKNIEHIIKNNKLSHAYIIELNNYDNDLEYIKNFIKLILCYKNNLEVSSLNCSECNICKLIDDNNYPDITYIEPDGQDIKKNQLLAIKEEYINTSLLENKRIYVIKEAEKLNLSAANTMLKFLEEPADDVIAILLTTNRYRIIDTILSRCQVLTIENTLLNEYSSVVDNLINYLFDKENLFINYNKLLELLPTKNDAVSNFKLVISNLINYLNSGTTEYKILNSIDQREITRYLQIIDKELMKTEYNINYKLWIDSLLAKLIGGDSND